MSTLSRATAVLASSGDGWDGHMNGWGGGWVWLWGTLMMVTWIAVIAGAAWLVLRSRDGGSADRGRARQILDERYARGELDSDEYRERLDHLP